MTIRWRVGILFVQLVLLAIGTTIVTGRPIVGETWFFAGLFAVVINPQLLEPWYPKPQDVLANSITALVLVSLSPKHAVGVGWTYFSIFLALMALLSLLTLLAGTKRDEGRGAAIGIRANHLSRVASAAVIYSCVFWLSAVEFEPALGTDLSVLGATWASIVILGRTNWEALWAGVRRRPAPCIPEGTVGPSMLSLSSVTLPRAGTRVELRAGPISSRGLIVTRIQRPTDAWAEVFVDRSSACAALVRRPSIALRRLPDDQHEVLGSVEAGSTDRILQFTTPTQLTIGDVVVVKEGNLDVLHQIVFVEVDRSAVRGGSHLVVRARAVQIGVFNALAGRLERHRWVPRPGSAVLRPSHSDEFQGPKEWIRLGTVVGTDIPVCIDPATMCEGHLTVLGMTRMGKTTLAVRLAQQLAAERCVTVLDQSGEYVGKRNLKPFAERYDGVEGLSVLEPKPGEIPADRALAYLEWIVERAVEEYREGEPRPRVVMVDEAHRFIPEPAGLGFGAPGRESSYAFGTLVMQIRKYGISLILVSQRTAVMAKSALSQCENVIAFRQLDQTGLDYLEVFMGNEVRTLIPTLKQGQAVVFGPALSVEGPVAVQVDEPAPATDST